MVAKAGDYIIRGVNGEIYPCKPDIFEKTYEYIGKDSTDKMSNADRIRSFSDEELAEFLVKVNTAYAEPCMTGQEDCKWEDYPDHSKGCKDCFKNWLQSEVEV